jgi:hypothetical protein
MLGARRVQLGRRDEARSRLPGGRLDRMPQRRRRIMVDRPLEARPAHGGIVPKQLRRGPGRVLHTALKGAESDAAAIAKAGRGQCRARKDV